MQVFEITKPFAPAFRDFTAKQILSQVEKTGYHTLGEVSLMGLEHYGSGLLQYYTGPLIPKGTARLLWLSVPEEERKECNAWSLLQEMKRRLLAAGIRRVEVLLAGDAEEGVKAYLQHRGFVETALSPPLIRTTVGGIFTKKILEVPASASVVSLEQMPTREVRFFLHKLKPKELKAAGIEAEIDPESFSKQMSRFYHKGEAEGVLLVAPVPEGGVILRLCRCIGGDPVKMTLAMVADFGRKLTRLVPPDTPVYLPVARNEMEQALRKMNSGIVMDPVWKGEMRYE